LTEEKEINLTREKRRSSKVRWDAPLVKFQNTAISLSFFFTLSLSFLSFFALGRSAGFTGKKERNERDKVKKWVGGGGERARE